MNAQAVPAPNDHGAQEEEETKEKKPNLFNKLNLGKSGEGFQRFE